MVLKRLADAQRDGDRIYAVIKSVAGSSDGRAKGLTAPRPEGQMAALERAYARAGVAPATVGLVEAHGTGTVAGDSAEVSALSTVFGAAGASAASCALGSVKSMIGHTKATAGVAGLIKVALALHHKVLPPTLHVTKPNLKLREAGNPFFVNSEPMPWVARVDGAPRRAGVSSFGFGGTNFHAVVEEHPGDVGVPPERPGAVAWPAELFVWTAQSSELLAATLQSLAGVLERGIAAPVRELAAAVARRAGTGSKPAPVRLAIIAATHVDLQTKIRTAMDALSSSRSELVDPRGIYLSTSAPAGKVAFVFPGQGSQYPQMLRSLAVYCREIRESVELADRTLTDQMSAPLSQYIFGAPTYDKADSDARMRAITDTAIAQPALGAVEAGLVHLLRNLGVQPDMAAGHSYGEYVALHAAGVLSAPALMQLSHQRGAVIKEACGEHAGTMTAVDAGSDDVKQALRDGSQVWIANLNAPRQTIIAGTSEGISEAEQQLAARGVATRRIPVACAFHSPLMADPAARFAAVLRQSSFAPPRFPVFSNSRVSPYPSESGAIAEVLTEHMTRPVRFEEQILAMYKSGARVFVEVGPRSVLSGLIRQILPDRKAFVLTIDDPERGITQLLHVLGQLMMCGAPFDIEQLFVQRTLAAADLDTLGIKLPEPSWLVNGGCARPRSQPSKPRLDPSTLFPPPAAAIDRAADTPTVTATVTTALARKSLSVQTTTSKVFQEALVKPPQAERASGTQQGVAASFSRAEENVMLQFQDLMSQFLRTQTAVMMTYLQKSAGPLADETTGVQPLLPESRVVEYAPPTAPLLPKPVAALPRTPAPVRAPTVRPAPAAGRSQSAKSATSGGTPTPIVAQPRTPKAPPPVETVPAEAAATASFAKAQRDLQAELLQIVSDRTGYPKDMLDLDLNIEADLGIDSIKRVEILSAFQRLCSETQRTRLQEAMETITAVKTLRATAKALDDVLGESSNGNQGAGAAF